MDRVTFLINNKLNSQYWLETVETLSSYNQITINLLTSSTFLWYLSYIDRMCKLKLIVLIKVLFSLKTWDNCSATCHW